MDESLDSEAEARAKAAMTSAGISCSPTCPTAPRRIVFIPTFGRSGESPEVPEGSRETSSGLSRTQ